MKRSTQITVTNGPEGASHALNQGLESLNAGSDQELSVQDMEVTVVSRTDGVPGEVTYNVSERF